MDIYTAITRVVVEVLAVSSGTLSHLVTIPPNASGPLDPNITLTSPGVDLVGHLAAMAIKASDIACDTFAALF